MIFAQTTTGSAWSSILFLVLLVGLFYVMLIRPQRQRMKKQQELAASLEIGDRVQTLGGIYGSVVSIDEDSVVLALEEGRMRVSRRAIAGKVEA